MRATGLIRPMGRSLETPTLENELNPYFYSTQNNYIKTMVLWLVHFKKVYKKHLHELIYLKERPWVYV